MSLSSASPMIALFYIIVPHISPSSFPVSSPIGSILPFYVPSLQKIPSVLPDLLPLSTLISPLPPNTTKSHICILLLCFGVIYLHQGPGPGSPFISIFPPYCLDPTCILATTSVPVLSPFLISSYLFVSCFLRNSHIISKKISHTHDLFTFCFLLLGSHKIQLSSLSCTASAIVFFYRGLSFPTLGYRCWAFLPLSLPNPCPLFLSALSLILDSVASNSSFLSLFLVLSSTVYVLLAFLLDASYQLSLFLPSQSSTFILNDFILHSDDSQDHLAVHFLILTSSFNLPGLNFPLTKRVIFWNLSSPITALSLQSLYCKYPITHPFCDLQSICHFLLSPSPYFFSSFPFFH